MPIETYLDMVDEKIKAQVSPVISYIQENYKQAIFDEKYSEKTHIPTWRLNNTYVAIGCRKKYISVYFGSSKAVETVQENTNTPYIIARKGCVNICYRIPVFPYEAIFKGIDACFG